MTCPCVFQRRSAMLQESSGCVRQRLGGTELRREGDAHHLVVEGIQLRRPLGFLDESLPTLTGMGLLYLALTLGMFFNPALRGMDKAGDR